MRRKWQPTPVILPGEFQGQRSLAGYSPWGCKESGMTEQLSLTHVISNCVKRGSNYIWMFLAVLPKVLHYRK